MDTIHKLNEEPGFWNNFKVNIGLRRLHECLGPFIDEEITVFHDGMKQQCGFAPCEKKCEFSNWDSTCNQPIPLSDCEVCTAWRDAILSHHSNQNGKVMWTNSKPHLWSQDKWVVAKVYMPNGHKNHNSLGDFDIAAFLCLMNQCKHFEKFKLRGLCEEVSFVRNSIMHSPNYQLKKKDLDNYMKRIRKLCKVLAKHHPNFGSLSREIDEIQRLDFILFARDNQAQNKEELEDKLVAALEEQNRKAKKTEDLLRRKVKKLKKTLSERDEIKTLHLSYKEKLKAVKQEAINDIGMKMVKIEEMVQQEFLAVKQEASKVIWTTMGKFLGERAQPEN